MTTLEKQKQWVQSVCDWIETKGDPYVNLKFYLNADQRRWCWNWIQFLEAIEKLQTLHQSHQTMDQRSFRTMRKTWSYAQKHYFNPTTLLSQ